MEGVAEAGKPTLTQVMKENPGLSIQECMVKLQMMNTMPTMPMLGQPPPILGATPPVLGAAVPGALPGAMMPGAVPAIPGMFPGGVPPAAAALLKPPPPSEVYVANLPSGVTGPQLSTFLGAAAEALKLNKMSGSPITTTTLTPEGDVAFLEFRSDEEASLVEKKLDRIVFQVFAPRHALPHLTTLRHALCHTKFNTLQFNITRLLPIFPVSSPLPRLHRGTSSAWVVRRSLTPLQTSSRPP